MRRLSTLFAAALFTAGTLAPLGASAQDMKAPQGDIDLTIGAGAGSGPDLLSRKIADILNREGIVTNPIVVNNRTGGGWTVASNYVIDHAGDENLLFQMSPTVFATPIVQGVPNFYEQITPLAVLLRQDLLIMVKADSPFNSLKDVIEAAKKEEYSISMAGANVGSTDHIVTSLMEKAGGVKINFIPYDGGGGQITAAILGGSVNMGVYPPDEVLSLIKSGEMKPLAILSEERSTAPDFKDVPTAKEQGYDILWDSPQSLGLPPKTDPALVAWWDDKIKKMVESETWKKMLADNYFRGTYVPASEAKAAMDQIYKRYLTVLTDLGLAKQK